MRLSDVASVLAPFAQASTYFSLFNVVYFILGWIIFLVDFPAIEQDSTFQIVLLQRAPRVLVRNALITFAVYSYWYVLLLSSPSSPS